MWRKIQSLYSDPVLLTLHSKRLEARNLRKGVEILFEPILAIDAQGSIVSIGQPVAATAVDLRTPFVSNSGSIATSNDAQLLLMHAFLSINLCPASWLRPAPMVVAHISEAPDNSLLHLEGKVIEALCKASGAYRVVISRGAKPTITSASVLLDDA